VLRADQARLQHQAVQLRLVPVHRLHADPRSQRHRDREDQHDLSEDPWRNLRDLIYEGRIEIPRLSVEGKAVHKAVPFMLRDELLSLSRMPNGRIDHPSDGSKDEADALACAAMTAVQLGGREEEGGERSYYEPSAFDTGGHAELPFEVDSLRGIWVTGLPELPSA
jgi:hypothetical protein